MAYRNSKTKKIYKNKTKKNRTDNYSLSEWLSVRTNDIKPTGSFSFSIVKDIQLYHIDTIRVYISNNLPLC